MNVIIECRDEQRHVKMTSRPTNNSPYLLNSTRSLAILLRELGLGAF